MRGTGTDQPVVAMKPGNAGGAKGLNGSADGMDQPARGGIHAESKVVRAGVCKQARSTRKGRNRCRKQSRTLCPNRWFGKRTRRSRRTTGAAGVDGQSIEAFETDLKSNLYKIWNRMSSGSYFPPPVRVVEIQKTSGGLRPLGIPTVADRVAQMVVKMHLEPLVEPHFHPDSYGYRPGKSALDAVATARQRCWRYDWVVDLDIKGFFDNLDWDLVLKTVRHHVKTPWVLLYIERWLKAPVVKQDGSREERTKGSPQGSVISPLLANLFMHYAFDLWMKRTYPEIPFEQLCR